MSLSFSTEFFLFFKSSCLILNLSQKDNNSHGIVTKIKTISQYINSFSNTGIWDWFKTVIPILFGTRDWLYGRQFFHGPRWGAEGNGFEMIKAHCIYCALYFYYLLHQLHLGSSGIRSQRLKTPGLKDMFIRCLT